MRKEAAQEWKIRIKRKGIYMEREERVFPSSSGMCNIHTVIWYPDNSIYNYPVGVIQIAHGMIDHIERFEEMAEFFAGKGFVVAGNDHLGHGDSVNGEEDYGYFAKGSHGADYLIKDMHRLTRIMKKMYRDIPYILIGHSMGSFMARKYACIYGDELDGVIFLGTGNQPKSVVNDGLKLAHMAKLVHGDRYRSRLINKLMFGTYNKRIKDNRTDSDWLTKDTAIVDEYTADPKCSYMFTANGYIGFLNVIRFDINEKNIARTPAALPVLFASGEEDPVGDYGKAVKKVFKLYTKYVDNVELRLYEDNRHELHSETNRQEVFEDLLEWIESDVLAHDID